jgi:hypothetical protein
MRCRYGGLVPNILVGVCAVLYLGTAVWFALRGQMAWALVYSAYAVANLGLIGASLGR